MDLSDLTREQAEAINRRLGPTLGYLTRLTDRMQKRAWTFSDPTYVAARKAHDALHEMCVRLHYQSIGNPGQRRDR